MTVSVLCLFITVPWVGRAVCDCGISWSYSLTFDGNFLWSTKGLELLATRRIFSLVEMITSTKFSNCPNVFELGVVQQ